MKIGIIGSGDVARSLARGFARHGDQAMLGTRNPRSDKLKGLQAGSFADTARFGELVLLCTRWDGTENAIKLADPKNLAGKVVVDVTNPLKAGPGGAPTLAVGYTDSAGEQVQRWVPEARVVKAFNIVGHASMVDPQFPGGPPDMLICGNDASAKQIVTGICTRFGWPVTDIGGIEGARLLEPLAMLWIVIGIRSGSWSHAWKLLRK